MNELLIAVAATGLISFAGLRGLMAWRIDQNVYRLQTQNDQTTVNHNAKQILGQTSQTYLAHRSKFSSRQPWREVMVDQIVQESADCKSFYLASPDGRPLPGFIAGQHLLVEGPAEGSNPPIRRCYSLSGDPNNSEWRITVKRSTDAPIETSLSRQLHERISVGDRLLVKGPQGRFNLENAGEGPVVLLAAGVGITPLISMLSSIIKHSPTRDVWLFFQVRDTRHTPFGRWIADMSIQHPRLKARVFFSRPNSTLPSNQSLLNAGRFTPELIAQYCPMKEADFFLCGPVVWMETFCGWFQANGVRHEQLHWESFGDAFNEATETNSTEDSGESKATGSDLATATIGQKMEVQFARTNTFALYDNSCGNLLELAQSHQVSIEAGCRNGSCGSCITRLLAGKVRFTRTPQCDLDEGEIATCIAQPVGHVSLDA